MIQLNGSTHTLQCVMSGAAATTNPDYWASWVQINSTALVTGDGAGGTLNGGTAVALVTGIASRQLTVKHLSIYNRDTAAVSLTFKMDVSGTGRYLFACVLQPGESVTYNEAGWAVTNTSGYFLSAIGAAGSTTQIQYNKNGSMTGNAGFTFDDSTQTLSQTGTNPSDVMKASTADPAAPSAGNMTTYIAKLCGRETPRARNALGAARWLELAEASYYRAGWQAGAAAGVSFGLNNVTAAGTNTAVTPTTTNKYTMMTRSAWANVITTQNQSLGIRAGTGHVFRGNAAGIGGFFFMARFGFESIKTGCRAFVGLSAISGTIVTSDPSASINIAGFGFDVADTAWTFMHNDNSGTATKDTISGQATLATNNTGFDAYVYCAPNDSTIYYRLDDLVQGTTLCDSSTSTDLPVNTTILGFAVLMSNGTANTTAGDAKLGVSQMTVYSER